MTTYPPALIAHLGGEATSICHAWRLIRVDATVFGFTDHDRPLSVGGTDCKPQSGFSASEARDSLGLGVDTVDIEGALSAVELKEEEIVAGLYDGASVETWLVNWRAPEQAAMIRKATIGRITRADGRFTAELESLVHTLDRVNGRYVRRTCDAEVGDARCGVNIEHVSFRGEGTVASALSAELLTVAGIGSYASAWFSGGVLTYTSGANAGRKVRVLDHLADASGVTLTLWPDSGAAPAPGDAFAVTVGCDKSFATCKAKFANPLNFRGFPHLPGNDAAYGYVTDGVIFDGSPLVP
ncbi:MAG: DUF2163 domain-containing protein [Rhizobiaceae bacterium]